MMNANVQEKACNTATRVQRCTMLRVAQSVPMQRNATPPLRGVAVLHGAGVRCLESEKFCKDPWPVFRLGACDFLQGQADTGIPVSENPPPSGAYARPVAEPRNCEPWTRTVNRKPRADAASRATPQPMRARGLAAGFRASVAAPPTRCPICGWPIGEGWCHEDCGLPIVQTAALSPLAVTWFCLNCGRVVPVGDFCPTCGWARHLAQSAASYPRLRCPLLARPENSVHTSRNFGTGAA